MLILSGTGNASPRNPAGGPNRRQHTGWRTLALLVAWASAACAEAPGGTEFLIKLDSGSLTPGVDSSMPIGNEPPFVDPGPGGTPGFTVPPFQQQDAAVQVPAVDASGPPMPTPDAGRPPNNPPPGMPDASQPPPVMMDSGSVVTPQPDAGMPPPSNTCATTPAFPTPDACSKCICMRCASQVMTCYASSDSAKNASCKQVRDCALQNRCIGNACYCGADALCLFPSGPCASVIMSAAGGDVTAASNDPENPVGRSVAVGTCSMSNCATECGL